MNKIVKDFKKNKCNISIKSLASYNEEESIEVISIGEVFFQDNILKAVYNESEISGMDGTKTTLNISDTEFSMERSGTTNTRMEFIKGEETITLYSTPYGDMEMYINTEELTIKREEGLCKVYCKYGISVSGADDGVMEMHIEINYSEYI